MSDRQRLIIKIHQYDFSIHEMELYLDTHPHCRRGLSLLDELRKQRRKCIEEYESRYGAYIVTTNDVPLNNGWRWIDSPWPWEGMEGTE